MNMVIPVIWHFDTSFDFIYLQAHNCNVELSEVVVKLFTKANQPDIIIG